MLAYLIKNGTFKYIKDIIWYKVQGWVEKCMASAGKEVLIKCVAWATHFFCRVLSWGLCQQTDMMLRKNIGNRNVERKCLLGGFDDA